MKWTLNLIIFSLLNTNAFADQNNPVVATVNGKEIKKSELLQYHGQSLSFVSALKPVTLERSLDDLINRIIGIDL